jgi:hypothetical protein
LSPALELLANDFVVVIVVRFIYFRSSSSDATSRRDGRGHGYLGQSIGEMYERLQHGSQAE